MEAAEPFTRWTELAEAHCVACGRRLALARAAAGMSSYQLADLIGMPQTSNIITRYEQGQMPGLPRMYAIADALGVTVDSIWGFHE